MADSTTPKNEKRAVSKASEDSLPLVEGPTPKNDVKSKSFRYMEVILYIYILYNISIIVIIHLSQTNIYESNRRHDVSLYSTIT